MLGNARNNEVVVVGNMLVYSLPTYVLFDMGSLCTFGSTQFVKKMNKEHELLGYELAVSQPTNKGMICSTIYGACSFVLMIQLCL